METEINGGCFKLQRLLVFYFFLQQQEKIDAVCQNVSATLSQSFRI